MLKISNNIILPLVAAVITIAAIVACGGGGSRFSINGKFLKMNQADFYVYSPDGLFEGIDTIHVRGGRFTMDVDCKKPGTLVIVLPNYTEIPVFAEPGQSVDINADASHIKELKVEGTDINEQMTEWRLNSTSLSPDQMRDHAEKFIRSNPKSIISTWLLRKYFIVNAKQDLKKAAQLAKLIKNENKENIAMARLAEQIANVSACRVGDKLPAFTANDINGKKVSAADFNKGKSIVLVWATWNFDGLNLNRQIKSKLRELKGKGKTQPKVLSISMDASDKEAQRSLRSDSISFPIICDGKMWDSPLIRTLGISTIPDNIVIENGKVTARHLSMTDLLKELER